MEEVLISIKTLAEMKSMTIKELAKACEISETRLYNIGLGRATMTAKELQTIAKVTGINAERIKV